MEGARVKNYINSLLQIFTKAIKDQTNFQINLKYIYKDNNSKKMIKNYFKRLDKKSMKKETQVSKINGIARKHGLNVRNNKRYLSTKTRHSRPRHIREGIRRGVDGGIRRIK